MGYFEISITYKHTSANNTGGGGENVKTWEMIKALTENPNLKARSIQHNCGSYVYVDENNDITWSSVFSNLSGEQLAVDISIEWELIQEPVPVLEAVKAYKEGQTIWCKCEEENFIYEPKNNKSGNWLHMRSNNGRGYITANEIIDGKWYIGNPPKE